MPTLSKSDFKIAKECPTKLYYKKKKYPSTNADNEYLAYLADGGYMVGKLAQLLYPGGVEIKDDQTAVAVAKTNALLQQENVILFEAAIQVRNFIIRIDILQKKGTTWELIEVKSKSYDSTKPKELSGSPFKPYIEDVTFQTYVLSEYLKENNLKATILPFLLLPDKVNTTKIEGLIGWFNKVKDNHYEHSGGFRKIEYTCIAEEDAAKLAELRSDELLAKIDVHDLVYSKLPSVAQEAENFVQLVEPTLTKAQGELSSKCKNCEYKTSDATSGFNECWGDLAKPNPNILELYRLGNLAKHKDYINDRKTSLYDINIEDLVKKNGEIGAWDMRRILQIENTKKNTEYFGEQGKNEIKEWVYPLYFIDFETTTNALPYHQGMRPYETLAFQWSCHKITHKGAAPKHVEWINTDLEFPNFKFAESLMQCIGNGGTPLMWSSHENTVLRHIYKQMEERNYENSDLKTWLESLVKMDDKDEGRFVDMYKFCLDHYFHAYMGGRASIKKVLPAIWNYNEYLHTIPAFSTYYKKENGEILDPYKTLEPLSDIPLLDTDDETDGDGSVGVVNEGTAAMRAYYQLLFEYKNNPSKKEQTKQMLLQYCKLDTMAMVIIHTHWLRMAENKNAI